MIGIVGEIVTDVGCPSTTEEALSGQDADNWRRSMMNEELKGFWDKGIHFQN